MGIRSVEFEERQSEAQTYFAPSALHIIYGSSTWAVGPGYYISRRWRFPSRNHLKTPLSFSLPAIFLVQDLSRPVSVEPLPRVWIIAQVSIPERRRHGQDRAVMIWIAWLAVTR